MLLTFKLHVFYYYLSLFSMLTRKRKTRATARPSAVARTSARASPSPTASPSPMADISAVPSPISTPGGTTSTTTSGTETRCAASTGKYIQLYDLFNGYNHSQIPYSGLFLKQKILYNYFRTVEVSTDAS